MVSSLGPVATHARRKYTQCIDCGRGALQGVTLSARGLCEDDALKRQMKSAEQLQNKSGPYYDEWRKAMVELMPSLADQF